MQDFLLQHYLWLKALHIIAVICWMAGLLYLPRLFVYHAQARKNQEPALTFKLMERRLYKFIMNPAMMVTWTVALVMLYANTALFSQGWMHAKLLLVLIMTGVHVKLGIAMRKFASDSNTHSHKYFRILNEVPTLLMIVIVILAVVKPF